MISEKLAIKTQHIRLSLIPFIMVMAGGANAQSDSVKVTLLGAQTIVVNQANCGRIIVGIRNDGRKAVSLKLHAEKFISKTTARPLDAQIMFSTPDDTSRKNIYSLANLAAGATQLVTIDVANHQEAGESAAVLKNNGDALGVLTALKYSFPFAVKLQSKTPDSPQLSFQHGKLNTVTLKNEDTLTYPIAWAIEILGKKVGGRLTLLPKSMAAIEVQAPEEWFTSRFRALFKEDIQEGTLSLACVSAVDTTALPWRSQTISFKAYLHYFPPLAQESFSILLIFIILFAGGICSLIVSYWAPNRLQRRALKELLANLALKIRALSFQIGSTLRVLVRVERKLLDVKLDSRSYLFSPDLTNIFNQCRQGLEMLNKRVRLLENIDTIYDQMKRQMILAPPPSLLERIEANLQKASGLLGNPELIDSDFQAAQMLIAEATTRLEALDKASVEFAQELAARVKWLRIDFDETNGRIGKSPICKSLKADKLPRPFEVLDAKFEDHTQIMPNHYTWLDTNTFKLNLIRDYVVLAESTSIPQEADKAFLKQLGLQNWDELGAARRLLQEMREGIFASQIKKAIEDKAFEIIVEPGVARPYQPVQFKAAFHQAELNAAAAREQFICKWAFEYKETKTFLNELGWAVSHYFTIETKDEESYMVKISFVDPEGKPMKIGNDDELTQKVPVKTDPAVTSHDYTVTEAIRLGIALFAVLLALIAGAREQIAKLDLIPGLIGVFIFGFTADQIKNLLAQQPTVNSQQQAK